MASHLPPALALHWTANDPMGVLSGGRSHLRPPDKTPSCDEDSLGKEGEGHRGLRNVRGAPWLKSFWSTLNCITMKKLFLKNYGMAVIILHKQVECCWVPLLILMSIQSLVAKEKQIQPYEKDADTVLLLHFDEGCGLPEDSSDFKNNAKKNTAAWSKEGRFGGCLMFDGIDDFVSIPDSESLNIGSGEMTLEAWVKPYGYQKRGPAIISKYGSSGYLLAPWYSSDYRMSMLFRHTSDRLGFRSVVANEPLLMGAWSHVAAQIGQDQIARMFVDGVEQNCQERIFFPFESKGIPLQIGRYKNDSWRGLIDEVRISRKARIELSYNSDKTGKVNLDEKQAFISDFSRKLAKIDSSVKTPHVKWANPWMEADRTGLVIYNQYGQRDILEFLQRCNLKMDSVPVFLSSFNHEAEQWWQMTRSDAIMLAKEGLEKNPNFILIGNVSWQTFPSEIKRNILQQVHNGTPLIYVGKKSQDFMNIILQWTPIDENIYKNLPIKFFKNVENLIKQKRILTGKMGNGRMVAIDASMSGWNSLIPHLDENSYWEYEIRQCLLIKIIRDLLTVSKGDLWKIKDMVMDSEAINNDKSETGKISIELIPPTEKNGRNAECKIEFLVYDLNGNEKMKVERLFKDAPSCVFCVPILPDGLYFAAAIIKHEHCPFDFGMVGFRVRSPLRICELTTGKEACVDGGSIVGKVILNEPPPDGIKVEIVLEDYYKRILDKIEKPIEKKEVNFKLALNHPLSILTSINARLLCESGVLFTTNKVVCAKRSYDPDFTIFTWGVDLSGRQSYLLNSFWGEVSKQNIGGVIGGCGFQYALDEKGTSHYVNTALGLARANLRMVPYITRIVDAGVDDRNENVRVPCLTDPAYRNKLASILRERAAAIAKYDPMAFSLGDENRLGAGFTDYCFSSTCQNEFRKYLKISYDSMRNLNDEWNTSFAEWDEVFPITMEEAKKKNQPSRWIDHRLHMDSVFAEIHGFGRSVVQNVIPGVPVGVDGLGDCGSSWGVDLKKMSSQLDYLQPYGEGRVFEQVRSFVKDKKLSCSLFGGYKNLLDDKNKNGLKTHVWCNLFHDFGSVTLYCASFFQCPLNRSDFSAMPGLRWINEELQEIMNGVGMLLMNSVRSDDGIGVYYSKPSEHASAFYDDFGPTTQSIDQFIKLLEDMGFQYKFIASDDLLDETRLANFRLLVFPCALAISKRESLILADYVRRGGAVIADIGAGFCSEHGKVYNASPLDPIFGIKRTAKLSRIFGSTGIWENGQIEKDLVLTTGKALGKSDNPTLIRNVYGKGFALYFNFKLDRYVRESNGSVGGLLRLFVEDFLKTDVQIECQTKLVNASSVNPLLCETVHYQSGSNRYICLLPGKNDSGLAGVTLPFAGNIYDLRRKIYLGNNKEFQYKIYPEVPSIFGLLPYEVKGVSAQTDKKFYCAGDITRIFFSIKVSNGKPGSHVVHMDVSDPDGNNCLFYSKNVLLQNGTGMATIPFAENDKLGEWKVCATEVVSGKKTEVHFELNSQIPIRAKKERSR
ncbi:MAG: beta-galactosidase [Verrucomicrobiae bacterium]|nr:beta-galactosidase [Verrucomicrobiae bacterium]